MFFWQRHRQTDRQIGAPQKHSQNKQKKYYLIVGTDMCAQQRTVVGSLTNADSTDIAVSLTRLFENVALVAKLVGLIWLSNWDYSGIDSHGQQIAHIYYDSCGLLHIVIGNVQFSFRIQVVKDGNRHDIQKDHQEQRPDVYHKSVGTSWSECKCWLTLKTVEDGCVVPHAYHTNCLALFFLYHNLNFSSF